MQWKGADERGTVEAEENGERRNVKNEAIVKADHFFRADRHHAVVAAGWLRAGGVAGGGPGRAS